ncbi:hypothetical protein OHA40_04150 [Nocardia sp. NBC_00508]|uniref:hypothetical protein n=1 Tax=Nocardia sp. NBC_00508 TaxID=2975992 RepID=UPI002E80DBF5|nr:hypothetical protein [Nocardia sp. NBC_00508]WUD67354.1 hypothetical protein OHA40_04150 [Nocardia sp. NBC_00508]
MSALHRRYLILLDPGATAGSATPTAIRRRFFEWLESTDARVDQDGGANRLVITASLEVAERIRDLEYVLGIEPYG